MVGGCSFLMNTDEKQILFHVASLVFVVESLDM